jgi:hypothetical protein
VIVDALDKGFAFVIESLKELVRTVDADQLYGRVGDTSFGEQVLRSAAAIEQTFGGLTANLWDDPFEWTLPETLSTPDRVIEHLDEVDALRHRFFGSIESDAALSKYVSVPSGEPRTLFELLLETLVRASDHRGRAIMTCHKKAQNTEE